MKNSRPPLDVGPVAQRHLGLQDLEAGMERICASPRGRGPVQAIVVRPDENLRQSVDRVKLSPELGVEGDSWARGCWKRLPDGSPHPDVQVAIMNSRVAQLLAGCREHWILAGDNLYVDMDLSVDHLPVGTTVRLGEALLEITAEPHLGCRKFAERYGADAVRFVNSEQGRQMRLRGVYARVLLAGEVAVGDDLILHAG